MNVYVSENVYNSYFLPTAKVYIRNALNHEYIPLYVAKNIPGRKYPFTVLSSFTYLKQEKLIRRHSLSFSTFNIKSLFFEGCARVVENNCFPSRGKVAHICFPNECRNT